MRLSGPKKLALPSKLFSPAFAYSTYFLKGNNPLPLSLSSQKRFLSFISADPISSSFLIYDSSYTQAKISTWKNKLPFITPYYAMKSNPIVPLLKDVVRNGLGMDCASKGEIREALRMGVKPEDIVYSNSVKEEKDLKYAFKKNVLLTTADTIPELQKILSTSSSSPPQILWRLSIKEDNSEQLATIFSNKFGDDLPSLSSVQEKLLQIKSMGVPLAGIHFHCGSGQHGSSSFQKAINLAKSCIQVGREMGHPMEVLDLGGGYPAGELSDKQIKVLKELEGWGKEEGKNFRVIAEPGRHFSAGSCYLAVRVIGKRIKDGKVCYHLNDGLYHSFNCVLMDGVTFEGEKEQFYQVWKGENPMHNEGNGKLEGQFGSLFGVTCDGWDIVCKSICVPDMEVGDWLVFGGMGAYTYGPKSSFNGMQALKKIVAWKGEIEEMQENKKVAKGKSLFYASAKYSVDDKLA